MSDYYNTHITEYHENTFHIDPSDILSPLTNRLDKGGKILDIGCGSGRDLLWLSRKGFIPTGIEKSRGLALMARQNSGCKVIECDFETFDFSSILTDAMILIGSLVHIKHARLEPVLQSFLPALTGSGHILITMKEGDGYRTGQDSRVFTLWREKDLSSLFSRLGLSVLELSKKVSKVNTGDIWLGYVLHKRAD